MKNSTLSILLAMLASGAVAAEAPQIEDVSVSATGVRFTVRTTLDERLYDLPLTVVVPAKGRKTAKVTVGKAKPVTVEVKDGKVLVDVVSGPVSVAF